MRGGLRADLLSQLSEIPPRTCTKCIIKNIKNDPKILILILFTRINHLISKLTNKFSKSRVGKKFKEPEFKVVAGIRLQLCDLFDELFQKSFLSKLHDSSYLQQLNALFQVVLQVFQMHHVLLSVIKGAQQFLCCGIFCSYNLGDSDVSVNGNCKVIDV